MGLADYPVAAAMRDAIVELATKVVERLRPPPRYATTVRVDIATRTVHVNFADAPNDDIPVSFGSICPTRPGQLVRIEGVPGDRYVADVMGEATILGAGREIGELGLGHRVPTWAVECDGRLLDASTYPQAFGVMGYSNGGSGNSFAVPTRPREGALLWWVRIL